MLEPGSFVVLPAGFELGSETSMDKTRLSIGSMTNVTGTKQACLGNGVGGDRVTLYCRWNGLFRVFTASSSRKVEGGGGAGTRTSISYESVKGPNRVT